MHQPIAVYLDTSVISRLEAGEERALLDSLQQHKRRSGLRLPFSAAHLQDAKRIGDVSLLARRCRFLALLSDRDYVYDGADVHTPEFRCAEPEEVFRLITEVAWVDAVVESMISTLPSIAASFARDLGLTPNVLNNIRPPHVIPQLDDALKQAHRDTSSPPPTIAGLLTAAQAAWPGPAPQGLTQRIAATFQVFEVFGFWPDPDTSRARLAGHVDSQHASAASLCDVLVTDDRRFRSKAAAAYEFHGITTAVMASTALSELLAGPGGA